MQAITFSERPWSPLSDREFAVLKAWLPAHGRAGRRGPPPQDLRRTLNAIFWIAASRDPWRALPEHLGKADTASRSLRRWAKAGVLDGLLLAVSRSKHARGCQVLRGMAWWIARAFRRMARVVGLASLARARRLGLLDAWPSPTFWLPSRHTRKLSENAGRLVSAGETGLRVLAHPGVARLAARKNLSRKLAPDLLRTAARMVATARRFQNRLKNFRQGWKTR